MEDKEAKQWAFVFEKLGKENLRQMLFRAAVRKDNEGRVVIEFDGENAMDVTSHYNEMEKQLEQ